MWRQAESMGMGLSESLKDRRVFSKWDEIN